MKIEIGIAIQSCTSLFNSRGCLPRTKELFVKTYFSIDPDSNPFFVLKILLWDLYTNLPYAARI